MTVFFSGQKDLSGPDPSLSVRLSASQMRDLSRQSRLDRRNVGLSWFYLHFRCDSRPWKLTNLHLENLITCLSDSRSKDMKKNFLGKQVHFKNNFSIKIAINIYPLVKKTNILYSSLFLSRYIFISLQASIYMDMKFHILGI